MNKKQFLNFLVFFFTALFSLTSSAQQIVSTVNSSTYTSCDGSATIVDPTIDLTTVIWHRYDGLIQTSQNSISNLCPGAYTVSYSTASGTATHVFSIGSNAPSPCPDFKLFATSHTPTPDIGFFNGSISLHVEGGFSPYHYYINNQSEDITASNTFVKNGLAPDTYFCSVVSANGCRVDTVLILSACAISLQRNVKPVSSLLTCDGSASINILSGGKAPYAYEWLSANDQSVVQYTQEATHLCAGSYRCIITDADGCVKYESLDIGYADTVTIVNTTFPGNVVIGSLGDVAVTNCSTNFASVATATIGGFSYQSPNTVLITWNLRDTTGALMYTVVAPYSLLDLSGGIYSATLTISCYQKSFDTKHFKAVDQLKLPAASLGISEQQLDEFTVVNPFDRELKLTFKAPTSGTVSLYTLQGGLVHQDDFSTCSALTVATERLASGTYFLHVNNGKETLIRKVIK